MRQIMNKKNSSPKQLSDKKDEKGKAYEYKLIRIEVCSEVFVT